MNKKNFALLGLIVAATVAPADAEKPYHMASLASVKPLADEKPVSLVETNVEITDGDKVAVRASEAGIAFFNDTANKAKYETAAAPKPKPELTIGSGFVVPEGMGPGKKPELYPFDTLAVGGFIFVPKSEAKPDPVKSLASTVSAATKRYAQPVEGKTRVDRKGKTVPLTVNTRVFTLVPVKAGTVYGEFTAPSDGAAIVRIADHVEAPAA
jgi:hypothetical protein